MSSYKDFPPAQALPRLKAEVNMWMATVRADSRPHLVPVWFVWYEAQVYLCIQPQSVKAQNLQRNPHVTLSLEDGNKPIICEGVAESVSPPWPEAILLLFQQKYNWDIVTDTDYGLMLVVKPNRWLVWG